MAHTDDEIRAAYYAIPLGRGGKRAGGAERLAFARAEVAWRKERSLNLHQAAGVLGCTVGELHSAESLITLPPRLQELLALNSFSYKSARALADVNGDPRQVAIGEAFADGRVGGSLCEPMVALAKLHPAATVEELITRAQHGGFLAGEARTEDLPVAAPEPAHLKPGQSPIPATARDLLQIAGQVDMIRPKEVPEYERQFLKSALRTLERHVRMALAKMPGGAGR